MGNALFKELKKIQAKGNCGLKAKVGRKKGVKNIRDTKELFKNTLVGTRKSMVTYEKEDHPG